MIVYSSMFIYIFLLGNMGKAYIQNKRIRTKYSSGVTLFWAVLILAMPVFFIGMRTNYIDTKGYIEGFKMVSTNWSALFNNIEESKAPVWNLYQWIIKRFITSNANVFLMITAAVQAGALLKLYYKYSNDYGYSMLLFFLSCSFVNMMNGIRQFLAVTFILYFVDFIFEKKYIKFILVTLIATLIHSSAIIWLPIIFIVQGRAGNRKTILFGIVTFLAIIFLDSFTGILSEALSDTEYAGYTNQFASDDGSNIVHTLIAAVPLVIVLLGKENIYLVNDKRIDIMVNISIIGVMVSLLANFTSGILIGRMPIYFTVFNFALLPCLFDIVFNKESREYIRILCVVSYVMYAIYYMMNSWGSAGMPYISDVLGINTWH